MRVFLSGPMGAGKSTQAALLADALGVASIDLDERIEAAAGMGVAELFEARGERAFRRLEREQLAELLAAGGDAVVALGGGTVVDDESRARLLDAGLLVTLWAPPAVLAERVGDGAGRPLLEEGAVVEKLAALLKTRAGAYAECHLWWDTRRVEGLVEAVRAALAKPPLLVPLGARSYRVQVGAGHLDSLRPPDDASSVVVVSDTNVWPLWAEGVCARLRAEGRRVAEVVIAAGEQHKNLESVERIWDAALALPVDRSSWLLGVGGGVVTDLTAFAASTLLRGVRVGLAPTSLLAMVDASVGGKAGFDRPEGKNLVGTFWQPTEVLADVDTLSTLPEEELIGGLAEAAKSAWLDSEAAVREMSSAAPRLRMAGRDALAAIVRRSVRLKARVVAADEREGGRRALLNLGHTLGHAFEAAAGFGALGHGHAVALGMVAAAEVERSLGRADEGTLPRLVQMLAALGLPTDWRARLDARTFDFVRTDKKRHGDHLAFVLPGAPGHASLHRLSVDELAAALGLS